MASEDGGDQDDQDVMGMPLIMPIAAPRRKSTSHDALVKWRKERREYEEKVKACCAPNEDPSQRMMSVKSSFDKRLLEELCQRR